MSGANWERTIHLMTTPEDAIKFSEALKKKASEALSLKKRNHRTQGSKNE